MPTKVKSLVVDTSGFVLNKPLWEYGEELVSIQEVFDEIKDVELKNYVLAFPVKVNFRNPKAESVKFVVDFAKKTGDYHVLSLTDIKVIALTYEIEVAEKGDGHLRKKPERPTTNTTVTRPATAREGGSRPLEDLHEMEEGQELDFTAKVNLEELESKVMDIVNEGVAETAEEDGVKVEDSAMETENVDEDSGVEKDSKNNANDDEQDGEDDDGGFCMVNRKKFKKKPKKFNKKTMGSNKSHAVSVATSTSGKKHTHLPPGWYDAGDGYEGWLTPENYHLYKDELAGKAVPLHYEDEDQQLEEAAPPVACMTGDFAMQNVCRHIGLSVIAPDGKLIRQTRCYVKRCHACFAVTSDMDKIFCGACGNSTLKRVSMTVNEDGSQQLWISRRPISTRGMVHNLPAPRGGKHAVMPLLTEDQRFPHQRPKRVKKLDLMNADLVDDDAPFVARDVSSAAFAHGNREGANMGYKGHFMHAKIWRPKRKNMVKK